jgi:shikimate kinase
VRAAQDLGARPVVFARDVARARRLAQQLGGIDVADSMEAALARSPRLVVDATPAGPPGGAPLIDPTRLPAGAVVFDMLVAARPTALLAACAAAGIEARAGLSMLAFQAARQIELLGDPLPSGTVLRRAGAQELARRDRALLLVGLRATGKTTLGRELARRLDLAFVDTDDEVGRATGRDPDVWIGAGQEAGFRDAERDVLTRLADGPPAVIATGGGAVLHAAALARLAARSMVVRLDAPDSVLLERLERDPRAMLRPLAPAAELGRQRAERDEALRALTDLVVDTGTVSVERAADALADAWLGLTACADAPTRSM